ncbi:IgGFc-binding protein [Myxococcota bacterium]|nr:IgGFc-binding protein [Myxococcota bacterium]
MNHFIPLLSTSLLGLLLFLGVACDDTERAGECEVGRVYCISEAAATCTKAKGTYEYDYCARKDQTCVPGLGCRYCEPGSLFCREQSVSMCHEDGWNYEEVHQCDQEQGYVCSYGRCIDACKDAEENRSYLGCEYWAVDLDNAVVSSGSAAAQQFAVVVSNPGFVTAHVRVEQNIAEPLWPREVVTILEIDVPPEGLRVLDLPASEVDGSFPGTFDTGTHSAITSKAFHIISSAPIAAYQFNPLENVDVFSNDASILFPQGALDKNYLVLSWPQTIAKTNDAANDFQRHLRAFLTIVATQPGTDVEVTLSTGIIGDGDRIPEANRGDTLHFDLDRFDVLNLETDAFLADFTGTVVTSDKPISVFTGSEASDVPIWTHFAERQCCADHLEHQIFPTSAAGQKFVASRTPPRTPAVAMAGGRNAVIEESDIFRIMALADNTTVFTSMAGPDHYFVLNRGEFREIDPYCDPVIESDKPLFVAQYSKGQDSVGVPLNLPGGDPSFVMIPPKEQWRDYYVFLTPDKYAFDFITIITPYGTEVTLDYLDLDHFECTKHNADCGPTIESLTAYEIINCQLSFPILYPELPAGENIDPGSQNDGYHVLRATKPVGLIISGFDKHVSYGYVGGMDLKRINVE